MYSENQPEQSSNAANKAQITIIDQPDASSQGCGARPIPTWLVLADNLPYAAMILLGAAVLWMCFASEFWRWFLAAAYLVYGVVGAFWIMVFICPYCHFYNTRSCPCGYGFVAPWLRAKKAGSDFPRQFKKHIPVIVPLWFVPLIVGVILLFKDFNWLLLGLLIAFVINSHLLLPYISRKYGCATCPQKDTCPWMGCGK